jgi:hypothetical protein
MTPNKKREITAMPISKKDCNGHFKSTEKEVLGVFPKLELIMYPRT